MEKIEVIEITAEEILEETIRILVKADQDYLKNKFPNGIPMKEIKQKLTKAVRDGWNGDLKEKFYIPKARLKGIIEENRRQIMEEIKRVWN